MAIHEKGTDDGGLEKGIQICAVIKECDEERRSWASSMEEAFYKVFWPSFIHLRLAGFATKADLA